MPAGPPLQTINQFVIEGEGSLDAARWREAVAQASAVNPVTRCVKKGRFGFTQLVAEGAEPEVKVYPNHSWDAASSDNAPFLDEPLDIHNGPTCQVILLPGQQKSRVIFRTHHMLMDGAGTKFFMEDVFRILRGEQPLGSQSTLSDPDVLAGKLGACQENPGLAQNVLSLSGQPEGDELGRRWIRQFIPGKYRNALVFILVELARLARSHNADAEGNVRIQITINQRRHIKDDRSLSNLTALLNIDLPPNATENQVRKQLLERLKNNQDLFVPPGFVLKIMSLMPDSFLRSRIQKEARGETNIRNIKTGLVSSLEKMADGEYSYDEFNANSAFAVPLPGLGNNFFLTLWEAPEGINIAMGMPKVLATNNRLETIFAELAEHIASKGKK
jgi:hypothetical protein